MADLTIHMEDDSLELQEILYLVEVAKQVDPTMTATKWVSNQIKGYANKRIKEIYKNHAETKTVEELRALFGPLSSVR